MWKATLPRSVCIGETNVHTQEQPSLSMQIEIGNPNLPKDTFSPLPLRLVYLAAGILVLVAPAWLTPSMYSYPFTHGDFETLVLVAGGALLFQACKTHIEPLYSRADVDGIKVVYSAIPGILKSRQIVEELLPWNSIREIVVLENDDVFWLNAVLRHSSGSNGGGRIVQLVNPGSIEGDEAKRAKKVLDKMRIGKAT